MKKKLGISGSGLSAQYAVTDSKDLQETGIEWANVQAHGILITKRMEPKYPQLLETIFIVK